MDEALAGSVEVPDDLRRENERLRDLVEELRQDKERLAQRVTENSRAAERHALQLQALLDSVDESIVIASGEGNVLFMNKSFREWLSPVKKTVLMVEDLFDVDVRELDDTPVPHECRVIYQAIHGRHVGWTERIRVNPDGSRVAYQCTASAICDDVGHVLLAIAIYRDVTKARQMDRMRNDYVGMICHDLRSPLALITSYSELLLRKLINENRDPSVQYAEKIFQTARRMNLMVQDLVESAALEARGFELHLEYVSLPVLISGLVQRTCTIEDYHRVRIEASESVPIVLVDPARLERAVSNVLANALKYSPTDREVTIVIAGRGMEVAISVSDAGPGIPADEIGGLFQRFRRRQADARREGFGLGLYITRLIAEAHGGRVWVESEEGTGSTFYLSLPLPVLPLATDAIHL